MEPRDDANPAFRAETESSATGGHMSSVGRPAGSLFETGDGLLPSDIERERRREETPSLPQEVLKPARRPLPAPQRTQQMRRRPRGKRRVRRTIQSVDPLSVLKISVLFYMVVLFVWLLFVTLAYNALEAAGFFSAIENINEGLVLEAEVDITLGVVLRWAGLIGVVFAIIGSLVNTLIALLYNGISRLVGGLEVAFVERDA